MLQVANKSFESLSSSSDRHERDVDGSLRRRRRRELQVFVESQDVFDRAAAFLEVFHRLFEARLREEIECIIEVQLVNHLRRQLVTDGDREGLVVERGRLVGQELDLVFRREESELVDVLSGVEEEGRGGRVVGSNGEVALERHSLDALQIDEVVDVEVVAHDDEEVGIQGDQLVGLCGDADQLIVLCHRRKQTRLCREELLACR